MESWPSLGPRTWGGDARGLRIGAPHSAPSEVRLLVQVDERVQAASLLGSPCHQARWGCSDAYECT